MWVWFLTLLLSSGLFGLALIALALRQRLGVAPLMLVMGVLEGLKTYVLTASVLDLPGVGAVRVGSVVSYMVSLVVVQLTYQLSSLPAARLLIWTLIGVSAALALLNPLVALLLSQPELLDPKPLDLQALAASGRIEMVGNLLLLVFGLFASMLLLNALQSIGLGRWASLVLSLSPVAALDTVLFKALAFSGDGQGTASLLATLQAKTAIGLWLATLGYAFLRWQQRRGESPRPQGGELFAALWFWRRIGELERQLQTDPLTGTLNRRYLEQTAPKLLQHDQMRGMPTSLLMVDLDHFKQINDTHGHLVGDQALQHVAQLLHRQVRRNDVVLRYGGEEFVILLPGASLEEACRVAEQIRTALHAAPLALASGSSLSIRATLGLACAPQDGENLRTLLQRADARLYQGKRGGRDCVVARDAVALAAAPAPM